MRGLRRCSGNQARVLNRQNWYSVWRNRRIRTRMYRDDPTMASFLLWCQRRSCPYLLRIGCVQDSRSIEFLHYKVHILTIVDLGADNLVLPRRKFSPVTMEREPGAGFSTTKTSCPRRIRSERQAVTHPLIQNSAVARCDEQIYSLQCVPDCSRGTSTAILSRRHLRSAPSRTTKPR